jgi:F-type H+-transporting ATPase subunit a
MILKNKFSIIFLCTISWIFSASGEFPGWGATILHHVADSDSVPFYGLPITKHVVMLLISAIVTILLSILATTKYRKNMNAKPAGISQIFEILIDFINKEIVIPNIGLSYARTWTPVAMTFFVFILTCNFLGLIPFFEFIEVDGTAISRAGSTATSNFGVTLGLATITFFAIIIAGIKKHGFIGHWKNMVPSGVPGPVLIILIPIEIIGMFVKPFALIMRLGANMTAGHIGMVAIFALPIILGNGIAGMIDSAVLNYPIGFFAGFIAVLLNTAIYGLEIIVCLVQAYVFTLLSCVFIGMAIHADH